MSTTFPTNTGTLPGALTDPTFATGPAPAFPVLPAPAELGREIPLSRQARTLVLNSRHAIRALLHGQDRKRLLVVVGPCSIRTRVEALEYGERLARLARRLGEELVLVMRVYLEKPRTVDGWKGFLTDPHLDGSGDLRAGLRGSRELLTALNDRGVPCAAELLDPFAVPYLWDCLSWAAVGARTSESQVHRQLVSGLPMPVGFKNGTQGNLEPAVHAMKSAQRPHRLLALADAGHVAERVTPGNRDVHVILRGGSTGTNYGPDTLARTEHLLGPSGPARPILVDCSHDNSGKDHTRQPGVALDVTEQFLRGRRSLLGLSLESDLLEGKQSWSPGPAKPAWGISVTDSCLGWDATERLLCQIARQVAHGSLRLDGS